MNWKEKHRVPEVTEWIAGIKEMRYPLRCHNCYLFPTVLIRCGASTDDQRIIRRWCPFCRIEEI
jgi:hypothetical protein